MGAVFLPVQQDFTRSAPVQSLLQAERLRLGEWISVSRKRTEEPFGVNLVEMGLDWRSQAEGVHSHCGWGSLHASPSPCCWGPAQAPLSGWPRGRGQAPLGRVPTGSRDVPSWEGPTGSSRPAPAPAQAPRGHTVRRRAFPRRLLSSASLVPRPLPGEPRRCRGAPPEPSRTPPNPE